MSLRDLHLRGRAVLPGAVAAARDHRLCPGVPGRYRDVKPAGNYAPALLAEAQARHRGFSGVLWLDGRERRFVEEAGVINVFFVIDGTVVTPGLSDTILPSAGNG